MVQYWKWIWILALAAIVLGGGAFLFGLGSGGGDMTDFINASSDLETLSKLIKLPAVPKAVLWQVLDSSRVKPGIGPSDWSLMAVMTFEASQWTDLASRAQPIAPNTDIVTPRFQALLDSDMRTLLLHTLTNPSTAQWRSGELFFRQPLSHGYFVVVPETNQVVLCLFTM